MGDVGFDTEYTTRRWTVEEQYIADSFPNGGGPRRSAMLGWQIVELRTGSFSVAWDNIGIRLLQLAHGDKVWVLDFWKIRGTNDADQKKKFTTDLKRSSNSNRAYPHPRITKH